MSLSSDSHANGYRLSAGAGLRYRLGANEALTDTVWARVPDEPTIGRPVPREGRAIDEADGVFLHPRWRSVVMHLGLGLETAGTEPNARGSDGDGPNGDGPNGTLTDLRWVVQPFVVSCQELDASFPSVIYSDPHVVPDPSVRVAESALAVPRVIRDGDDRAEYSATVDAFVSSLAGGDVEVRARAPRGWSVEPESVTVPTSPGGIEQVARFQVSSVDAADVSGPFPLVLEVRRAGAGEAAAWSSQGYRRIEYPHIRPAALLERAEIRCVPFVCEVEGGLRVGYVDGVGDKIPAAFHTLGVPLQRLGREDLLEGDLTRFDVIMTGVRAYKVREDLAAAQSRLMEWVDGGGVLLVQYNKFEFNAGNGESSPFAPFPGTLVGRRRVTVEESPVVVNHPEHPVLASPNELGERDWSGWVQERGLYFLDFDDPRYLDLVTLQDPWPYNAGEKGGALVAAPYGDGTWAYIGVGLFRQLPAGVPGAYRLLANLLALGTPG